MNISTLPILALAGLVAGCAASQAGLAPAGAPPYVPANASPPTLSAAANELVGPTWQWQRTQLADGKALVPAAADRYTLAFQAGGRVNLRADCNRGGGSYEVNASTMKFGPAATTKMACPPGSQDGAFLEQLTRVERYEITGNELTLALGDGATMRFRAAP